MLGLISICGDILPGRDVVLPSCLTDLKVIKINGRKKGGKIEEKKDGQTKRKNERRLSGGWGNAKKKKVGFTSRS